MPEPNTGDRSGRGSRSPDYQDFTTSSVFRGTGQPPTRSALLTANWRGCCCRGFCMLASGGATGPFAPRNRWVGSEILLREAPATVLGRSAALDDARNRDGPMSVDCLKAPHARAHAP